MELGEYEKCGICGQYGYVNHHKCPPAWEVNIPDYHGDEWVKQYADSAAEVAIKMAEKYDSDDCDFELLDGGEVEILVRKPGRTNFKRYLCTGESIPIYYSREA